MTHFHPDLSLLNVDRMISVKSNYCQGKGHWKNKCPVLGKKVSRLASTNLKPVALAGPVPHVNPVAQAQELSKPFNTDYSPFLRGLCFTIGK